jgi:hypothetical protein
MTKKFILRLCLMMATVVFLYSCRTDDLAIQENKSQEKATVTSRIIHLPELQENQPLFSQLAKLSKNKIGASNTVSKIFTDAENGFSVDLNDVLYTEDSAGNKTYTFKIQPREGSAGKLENFILSDLGNSQFAAYISTYDTTALENLEDLTVAELKNHVTMVSLGSIAGAEIFGKYNANFCTITVPEFVNIFVPGTLCYTGDHNYSQIGDCNFASQPGGYPPTDSYSYTGISYTTYDTCGGGASPGNGSSGSGGGVITTSPHGGGNTDLPDLEDPCEKTKTMLAKPDVIKYLDSLKAQSKKEEDESGEKAFQIRADGTTSGLIPGGKHNVKVGSEVGYQGVYHNHTPDGVKMFSPSDIINMLKYALAQPNGTIGNGFLGMIGSETCDNPTACTDGFLYHNYIIRYSGISLEQLGNEASKPWDTDALEKDYDDRVREMKKNPLYTSGNKRLKTNGLQKLFFDTLKNMGIEGNVNLQKIENDGSIQNIILDNSNNPMGTPCL